MWLTRHEVRLHSVSSDRVLRTFRTEEQSPPRLTRRMKGNSHAFFRVLFFSLVHMYESA